MAPADIEWVFGIVRAGRDYQGMEHAKSGGAGYEFTATVIVRGRTAEIVGGAGRLTPVLAKEIEVNLYEQGITTAIWERYNGDPKRIVRETRGRSARDDPKADADLARALHSSTPATNTGPASPAAVNGAALNGGSLNGASLNGGSLNGAGAFVSGFRPDVDSLRGKPPGSAVSALDRGLRQKVGTG